MELLNPFSEQDNPEDKLSIVDVKARASDGRQFDVEMQLLSERSFTKRILFYWSELHQQQLDAGDSYDKLRPTISVCLTNFVLFPEINEYRLPFELSNREHNVTFSSDMLVILVELPKFKVEPENTISPLDAWLFFLCKTDELNSENLPNSINKLKIRKALEELLMLSQDDLERERYLARCRVLRDESSRLKSAHADGREEGREEELIGIIHFCQNFLKIAKSPIEQLNNCSANELRERAKMLQDEILKQRK